MTGRDEQLQSLEKFYESEANNLTILYGRRGIGKTALLREFARTYRFGRGLSTVCPCGCQSGQHEDGE